jgi:hypothetical protein
MATILLTMFSCIVNLVAQDWPQYLGPDRNSTSTQKGIRRSWPEGGPEVLWNVNIGIGYGGPIARAGKVYLLDRNDEVGDIVSPQFGLTIRQEKDFFNNLYRGAIH